MFKKLSHKNYMRNHCNIEFSSLFYSSVIISTHNPRAHWCICSCLGTGL